ncbi:MAG: TrkH family potassium uptake protein [Clostridia bacterium]|nr:TrkH family potassium uptake protein [Clostridia bacterium]
MNFKLVFRLAGKTLLVEAACMLLPLLVSLIYREDPVPLLLAAGITGLAGTVLSLLRSNQNFFAREGFFSAGLIWVLFGLFGALPFYIFGHMYPESGSFFSYIDCLFEAISGFTTTGASILTAVEGLPKGLLFWRSFTHWLGGMGVLILTIALLPSLGARTLHLIKAESPGPVVSKLVPKSSESSKILYGIYFALTAVMVICLLFTGMPLYDCLVNAFATAGTGGFSVLNLSIGGYNNPAAEIIIATFMLIFSVNFAAYFLILCGKWKQALKSDELRFFVGVVAVTVLLITANIVPSIHTSVGSALRYAYFQVASIISTTGFATTNFDLWPQLSRIILVLLMICGACAGSTGGGVKCSRVLLLLKNLGRELKQIMHPRSVNVVKLDGRVVEEKVLHTVMVFLSAYMLIAFGATLIVALDNYSFGSTFTAVLACIGNIGPGLELVGPMGNYSAFSPLSKLTLTLCMVIGRLEIFPILVLFSRSAWRHK